LLTALVIVADWLASDDQRFRYGDHRSSSKRAKQAWDTLAMPPMWTPAMPPRDTEEHMSARFPGFAPRPVQEAAATAAWDMERPGLLIVEAPMGVGKTEAALLAAEVLAARFGCGGVFVALPTMATSDAMFSRVLDWVHHLPAVSDDPQSVFLAHGKARLNDEFAGLARIEHLAGVYDEDQSLETVAAGVLGWFTGRKKGPLANLVVGTIDQVLFGALQAKHLVLRHLALTSKVVVIDEVHAADVYMRQYLHRMLHWLGAAGTPVVLLSATLPPSQRRDLVRAYASGQPHDVVDLTDDHSYPALTTWSTGVATRTPVPATAADRTVRIERLADGDLVKSLMYRLRDGGCAAVIHNTVGRAQQTATELRDVFGDDVLLVHSRFTATDRISREVGLRRRLGPPATSERPYRLVVVGTQVLEQSLDIDVDVMVSDLAPFDLLLQRMGRLHRHERAGRPSRVSEPAFLVTGADWTAEPPSPDRGSRAVYRDSMLLRSAAVLSELDPSGMVLLPRDIPRLVAAAYRPEPPGPSSWSELIGTADRARHERDERSVYLAESYLLDLEPPRGEPVSELTRTLVDGQPEDGRSQVRDSEDGLEVIVVQRFRGEVRVMPGAHPCAGQVIPTDWMPDPVLARVVAASTLRLPLSLTHPRILGRVIAALEGTQFAGWQRSHWLVGQLVLVLDDELQAGLEGHQLTYDDRQGLVVKREDIAP